MSTLWNARVAEVDGARCVIELAVAHPDAGPFKTDLVFAIRLLGEQAAEYDLHGMATPHGPLGEQLLEDDLLSTSWCEQNAPTYIESIHTLDPLPQRSTTDNWQYPNGTAVRYEIVTTDPRWAAHLKVDQTWRSTVYS